MSAAPTGRQGSARPGPRRRGSGWRVAILIGALPMFVGLFGYVVDAPPLYALAKVWAALTLPLSLIAAIRMRLPYAGLLAVGLAWLLGVTPLVGIAVLGNDGLGALASTVKVWPLVNALGLAGLLWWLRSDAREIGLAIGALSALTFAFLIGAGLFAPASLFEGTIETTKVFLSDPERGRRINAPMMFGILGLFWLNRDLWRRPRVWKAVLVVGGLAAMVLFYKQRAQIAGTLLGLGLGGVLSLRRWRTSAMLGAAAVAIGGAVPAWVWLGGGMADSLGGSLSIRQVEADYAMRFLNDAPWRWFTGVGSATRIGEVTLGDVVGTPFFFPSDLGWLGVVFEYGAIGAALMLALHLFAIGQAARTARMGPGTLRPALLDYAIFLLVVSPVVSVVLSPGELATVLALAWWLGLRTRPDPACAGSVSAA